MPQMWQDDILAHAELNAQILGIFILKYINYHIMCILYKNKNKFKLNGRDKKAIKKRGDLRNSLILLGVTSL